MRLLIAGTGGHGNVLKEAAKAQTDYHLDSITFVDDKSTNAIGTTADLKDLQKEYDMAIVAIGNNRVRASLQRKLKELGYDIPTLIHPTSYVSSSARIGEGTVRSINQWPLMIPEILNPLLTRSGSESFFWFKRDKKP